MRYFISSMATTKQKLVASKLVENGGNLGKAMIASGYSEATAKTPKKLTESIGWKELMKNCFSDELLTKTHKQLLESSRLETMNFSLDDSDILIKSIINLKYKLFKIKKTKTRKLAFYWAPDYQTRSKALDLAYKVRGLYTLQSDNKFDEYDNLSDEELDSRIQDSKAQIDRYKNFTSKQ